MYVWLRKNCAPFLIHCSCQDVMLSVKVLHIVHAVHDTHGENPIKNTPLSMVKKIIVVSSAVPNRSLHQSWNENYTLAVDN